MARRRFGRQASENRCRLQRDRQIECLMRRLWAESTDENPMGELLAEDVALALAGRLAKLARSASCGRTGTGRDAPPLPADRLAQAINRIQDELDANILQGNLPILPD